MDSKLSDDRERMLNKALELAQKSAWQAFTLNELASSLECTLVEVKRHFRSKDDMAEALFDRADETMLKRANEATFQVLKGDEKLVDVIMCWFLALQAVKPMVREILTYKLEPGHVHLQVHGITRVSRTVQWFLCAADRQYTGLARVADEVAVTSAYLASFSVFLNDESSEHSKTRVLLKRLIRKITQGQQLIDRTMQPVTFRKHDVNP